MRRTARILLSALAVFGLVATACGDDDSSADSPTTAGATTAAPTTAAVTTAAPTTAARTTAAATTVPAVTVPAFTGDITVFAAASLTAAFTEIGEAFHTAYPDANVTFSFAASSELVTQIQNGAPADVFASADLSNMTKLTDANLTGTTPVVFAKNLLQIIVGAGNPKGITEVADLANDDLITVICAPEVPCGKYAARLFTNAAVTVNPDSLEENVKAVVTKVTAGEADAGIVYTTDVLTAGDTAEGVEIPADINVIAQYPIAATRDAANAAGAQAFIDFVVGQAGQAILAKYGFRAP